MTARQRRWIAWTLTGVLVPFVLAAMLAEVSWMWVSWTWVMTQTFLLALVSFFAGSASSMRFLAPQAQQRPSRAPAIPAPALVSGGRATPSAPARSVNGRITHPGVAFASSHDDGKMLEIVVLISGKERMPDPADGAPGMIEIEDVTDRESLDSAEVVDGADGSARVNGSDGASVLDGADGSARVNGSDGASVLDGADGSARVNGSDRADVSDRANDADGENVAEGETAGVVAGPYPGSALPAADGSAPHRDYIVKGNSRSLLYHTDESPYFSRTKAGVWFRSAEEAENAGFAPWNRRALP